MAKAMCHISPSPVDPVMGKGRFPLAAWLPAAFFIYILCIGIYIYVFICVNIYIYIYGCGSKLCMERSAVFRTYGTKGLRNWSCSGPLECDEI